MEDRHDASPSSPAKPARTPRAGVPLAEAARLGQRLTPLQVFWMELVSRLMISIAVLPTLTASRAGRDAWLALLVGIIPGVGMAWLVSYPCARLGHVGLAAQARHALGRVGGNLLVLLYLWAYLHVTAILVREYSEAIVTAILPTTPLVVVTAVVGVLLAITAAQDTPTVARVATLIGPVMVLSVLFVAGLVTPAVDMARLRPFLSTGIRGLISGVLLSTAWYTTVFSFPVVAPSVVDMKQARRALLGAAACGGLGSAFIAGLAVVALTGELAVKAVYPLLKVARLVVVGEFFQRIDAVAVGAWGLGLIVTTSVVFHAAALALKDLAGLSDHRTIVKPMAVIGVLMALALAGDTSELRLATDARVLVPYFAAYLWLPAAIFAVASRLRTARSVPSG